MGSPFSGTNCLVIRSCKNRRRNQKQPGGCKSWTSSPKDLRCLGKVAKKTTLPTLFRILKDRMNTMRVQKITLLIWTRPSQIKKPTKRWWARLTIILRLSMINGHQRELSLGLEPARSREEDSKIFTLKSLSWSILWANKEKISIWWESEMKEPALSSPTNQALKEGSDFYLTTDTCHRVGSWVHLKDTVSRITSTDSTLSGARLRAWDEWRLAARWPRLRTISTHLRIFKLGPLQLRKTHFQNRTTWSCQRGSTQKNQRCLIFRTLTTLRSSRPTNCLEWRRRRTIVPHAKILSHNIFLVDRHRATSILWLSSSWLLPTAMKQANRFNLWIRI